MYETNIFHVCFNKINLDNDIIINVLVLTLLWQTTCFFNVKRLYIEEISWWSREKFNADTAMASINSKKNKISTCIDVLIETNLLSLNKNTIQ